MLYAKNFTLTAKSLPFTWSGLFYHNILDWSVSSSMVSS